MPELIAPASNSQPTTGINESVEQDLTVYHFEGKLYIKQTILKGDNRMNVRIFNAIGQEVQLINGNLPYNQYQEYPLNDLPAGPFFVKAQVGDVTATKKIVLVR